MTEKLIIIWHTMRADKLLLQVNEMQEKADGLVW